MSLDLAFVGFKFYFCQMFNQEYSCDNILLTVFCAKFNENCEVK